MYLFFLFVSFIGIVTLTHAAPTPNTIATICTESGASSAVWAATTSSAADDCAPGGLCDCSRIADRNSDEFFQCVTNPKCEHCWVTRSPPATTTTPKIPVVNGTTSAMFDYRTMSPGTYTITTNGTVLNIVVMQQTITPTSSALVFVTMTETVVVTLQSEAQSLDKTTNASPASSISGAVTACTGRCACSQVEGEGSIAFSECLANPDCEQCQSSDTAARATESQASSSIVEASFTFTDATRTSTSAAPAATCPNICDCSNIEDKESESYFQCITNPVCERCNTGGS